MAETLCLIQSPYFHDYGPMRRAAGTYFPLGLGYVAAYAKAAGYGVLFLDPNVQDLTPEQIARTVQQEQPLAVGISFMTPQFHAAKALCEAIKKLSPPTPIALGGAHPSVMPERTLREIPDADFAVIGEGELTVAELLDALSARSRRFARIAGLAWRNAQGVVLNAPRAPIRDLDSLPFPDRSLIDQSLYRAQSFLSYSPRTATIYTSRGCPGRCVFCCSGHRLRTAVRERSLQNAMQEIDQLREKYDIEYLLIKDDTFTLKRSRIEAFCKAFRQRHPDLKWHCMGRANTVDPDVLSTMRSSGLHDIFFGIESGNDDILKTAQKGITTSQARAAVQACDRLGIRTYGAFILGLPGETAQTAEQTIRFACSLPLTAAGFSVLIPYPGTKAFEEHFRPPRDGRIHYHDFIASTGLHYVKGYTGLDGLRGEDLVRLVAQAQRRFYMRPRQICRMLRHATPSMISGYVRGSLALIAKESCLRRTREP